ncbi:HRDC domain-containing protein [Maioricimonas sp. JC845]|uniref:ribonuclease D n=1 Tax=Maioricimonas sp. JC845 TaxID=3232138 RepID=UPI00345991A6
MPGRLVTSQSQFDTLCDKAREAGVVAFDTEFVSESYFRPRLCLIQLATTELEAVIDPFEIEDLSKWWEVMRDPDVTVIVHGGREEIRFCMHLGGGRPQQLVDVQIAEGLLSRGFPLGFQMLVPRVTGKRIQGSETRTDWQRRPLTSRQIDYALEDVRYLIEIWGRQQQALSEKDRVDWAWAEFERLIDDVEGEAARNTWRRLPGIHRLSRRQMAVARELYQWRAEVAESLNRPVRSMLRDDLLIEISTRRPRSLNDLNRTRGMHRREYQRMAGDILAAVERAMALPEDELPEKPRPPQNPPQEDVLSKVLGLALANRCNELGLSTNIVGTMNDLQELVRWHMVNGDPNSEPLPRLMQGWRGRVCGDLLTDLLKGRYSIRIADVLSETPLAFEAVDGYSAED